MRTLIRAEWRAAPQACHTDNMQLTVLSSGPLSAIALHGLIPALGVDGGLAEHMVCVTSTAADLSVAGLRFMPDTDAAVRAFSPGHPAASSRTVTSTLASLGLAPTGDWPVLDDENVAFAVARSYLGARGQSLAEAVEHLARGARVRILPATSEPVELHVVEENEANERSARHVLRWLADAERGTPVSFAVAGLDRATPTAGVLDAIRDSEVVLLLPMSPVLDAPGIIGVPGLRDALRGTSARVVVMSPAALPSPRDVAAERNALATAGLDATSAQVARLYTDFADEVLIDDDEPAATYPKSMRVTRVPLVAALSGDEVATRRVWGVALGR